MKKIIVLIGPSGTGKTTLGMILRDMGIPELISHSTREMRVGEEEGNPYYFITKAVFDTIDKIEETCYAGNYYCLSREEVEAKFEEYDTVYAITDVHGLKHLQDAYGRNSVVEVFITAPIEVLEQRMRDRGDSEEKIQERLNHIHEKNEFAFQAEARYVVSTNQRFHKVVDDLKRAVKTIKE